MTTLDLQVSSANDDAHELDDNTGFSATANNIRVHEASAPGSRYNGGFRLTNVTIPPGAIITAAYISVKFPDGTRDSPREDIYLEDIDDAPDFSTDADVTGRTRTSASLSWSDDDLGTGVFHDSPDISPVVQEVIDRAGWANGNDMVVLVDGQAVSTVESGTRFVGYENVSSDALKLHIEYIEGKTRPILKPVTGHVPIHQLQL